MLSEIGKDRIKKAKVITILTGAGVSAESGIPTFRGEGGLWKDYLPEDLASPEGFKKSPQLVWEWYSWRRNIIRKADSNNAHLGIKKLENNVDNLYVITQNVDGIHKKTGIKNLIELHGNIFRNKCYKCGRPFGDITSEEIPVCDVCGGYIRPDVVWFGETIPANILERSYKWSKRGDVFLLVGTSGIVYPAASFPLYAKENGAYVIEINKEKTVLSPHINETILEPASEGMKIILDIYKS